MAKKLLSNDKADFKVTKININKGLSIDKPVDEMNDLDAHRSAEPLPDDDFNRDVTMKVIRNIEEFDFWCQHVLPTVYEDSLSYYECLGKVVHFVNEQNKTLKEGLENVDKLNSAFLELQNFVNKHYDELSAWLVDKEAEFESKIGEEFADLTKQITDTLQEMSEEVSGLVDETQKAIDAANNAVEQANEAVTDAQAAVDAANEAVGTIGEAVEKAENAADRADAAVNEMKSATEDARRAASEADAVTEEARTAVENANAATQSATEAATAANSAKASADAAAKTASEAASNADTARENLLGVVTDARDAVKSAQNAASQANEAATNASNAATKAEEDVDAYLAAARDSVSEAIQSAQTATENANDAAGKANDSSAKADEATQRANDAAEVAEEANVTATDAAEKATKAASDAEIAVQDAKDAVSKANTATDLANAAAKNANEAAKNAADASKVYNANALFKNVENEVTDSTSIQNTETGIGVYMNTTDNMLILGAGNNKKEIKLSSGGLSNAENAPRITNLGDPTGELDAVNKKYVDNNLANYVKLNDELNNKNTGNFRIIGEGNGLSNSPIFQFYNGQIYILPKKDSPVVYFGAGNSTANYVTLRGLLSPTNGFDAANKDYVDAVRTDAVLKNTTNLNASNFIIAGPNSSTRSDYADEVNYRPTIEFLENRLLLLASGDNKVIELGANGTVSDAPRLTHVANPVENDDAVNKLYVDNSINGCVSKNRQNLMDTFGINLFNKYGAGIQWANNSGALEIHAADHTDADEEASANDKVIYFTYGAKYSHDKNPILRDVHDPVQNQDVATKHYVDNNAICKYANAKLDPGKSTIILNTSGAGIQINADSNLFIGASIGSKCIYFGTGGKWNDENAPRLLHVGTPKENYEAANKLYVDTQTKNTVKTNTENIMEINSRICDKYGAGLYWVSDGSFHIHAPNFPSAGEPHNQYDGYIFFSYGTKYTTDNKPVLRNIATPQEARDAATKGYVDTTLSSYLHLEDQNIITSYTHLGYGATGGNIELNNSKDLVLFASPTSKTLYLGIGEAANNNNLVTIENVANPTKSYQAATKGYVDNSVSGLATVASLSNYIEAKDNRANPNNNSIYICATKPVGLTSTTGSVVLASGAEVATNLIGEAFVSVGSSTVSLGFNGLTRIQLGSAYTYLCGPTEKTQYYNTKPFSIYNTDTLSNIIDVNTPQFRVYNEPTSKARGTLRFNISSSGSFIYPVGRAAKYLNFCPVAYVISEDSINLTGSKVKLFHTNNVTDGSKGAIEILDDGAHFYTTTSPQNQYLLATNTGAIMFSSKSFEIYCEAGVNVVNSQYEQGKTNVEYAPMKCFTQPSATNDNTVATTAFVHGLTNSINLYSAVPVAISNDNEYSLLSKEQSINGYKCNAVMNELKYAMDRDVFLNLFADGSVDEFYACGDVIGYDAGYYSKVFKVAVTDDKENGIVRFTYFPAHKMEGVETIMYCLNVTKIAKEQTVMA